MSPSRMGKVDAAADGTSVQQMRHTMFSFVTAHVWNLSPPPPSAHPVKDISSLQTARETGADCEAWCGTALHVGRAAHCTHLLAAPRGVMVWLGISRLFFSGEKINKHASQTWGSEPDYQAADPWWCSWTSVWVWKGPLDWVISGMSSRWAAGLISAAIYNLLKKQTRWPGVSAWHNHGKWG